MKKRFVMSHSIARNSALQAVKEAPDGYVIEVREPSRTLEQNALLWKLLADLSDQLEWSGAKRSPEDWKDLLSAAFRHCDVVPGLTGGLVALGMSTSGMGKREFSEFIDSIYAFGTLAGVRWSTQEHVNDL